jgi:hypothetical protein
MPGNRRRRNGLTAALAVVCHQELGDGPAGVDADDVGHVDAQGVEDLHGEVGQAGGRQVRPRAERRLVGAEWQVRHDAAATLGDEERHHGGVEVTVHEQGVEEQHGRLVTAGVAHPQGATRCLALDDVAASQYSHGSSSSIESSLIKIRLLEPGFNKQALCSWGGAPTSTRPAAGPAARRGARPRRRR